LDVAYVDVVILTKSHDGEYDRIIVTM